MTTLDNIDYGWSNFRAVNTLRFGGSYREGWLTPEKESLYLKKIFLLDSNLPVGLAQERLIWCLLYSCTVYSEVYNCTAGSSKDPPVGCRPPAQPCRDWAWWPPAPPTWAPAPASASSSSSPASSRHPPPSTRDVSVGVCNIMKNQYLHIIASSQAQAS